MPPSPETESTTAPVSEQTSVLQNNEEYMVVYRAIQALKSQLDRAKNDMDILVQLRDQALAKPQEYIQSLTDSTAAAAPRQQAVAMIPSVYVDPYIGFADSTAIDAYMQCIRIQAQRGDELQANSELCKPTNSAVQPLSLGARTPVTTKAGKSASALHPFVAPNSTNIGLLTGVTAVATPEQSPKRTQSAADMVRVAVAGEGSGGVRGAKHSSVAPTGTAPMTATSVHSAQINKSVKAVTELPQMNRANTEPVPRPAVSAATADSAAASIPVSPASRGKSQKTLTPQILEAFRRQISEERLLSPAQHNHEPGPFSDDFEDDDDDDEYYNQLVRSVSKTHIDYQQKSLETNPKVDQPQQQHLRVSGKSFLFNGHHDSNNNSSSNIDNNHDYNYNHQSAEYLQSQPHHHQKQQPQQQHQPSRNAISSSLQSSVKRKCGRPKKKHLSESQKKGPRRAPSHDSGKPKPASYNIPWSDAEQERLEALLVEYPDEEVANDRWRKISEALGTRTMRQVASRVQKYFIKLAKAGLPVPGRVPNTAHWSSMGNKTQVAMPLMTAADGMGEGSSSFTSFRKKPSRRAASGSASSSRKRKYVDFTSSSDNGSDAESIDIDMDEDASEAEDHGFGMAVPYDRKGKQADRSGGMFDSSNDQYDTGDFHLSTTGVDANEAGGSSKNRRAYAAGINPTDDNDGIFGASAGSSSGGVKFQSSALLRSAKSVHLGYRCDSCFAEPIVGIRWHCIECRGAQAVDLCDECREEGNYETAWHKVSHSFHAIRDAEMDPYYANDVASSALREYSYLA
ncbi:hypothetical protein LPJ66_008602 [Kickxella alabastrina]|uniref:Uncharacterized protein n=1 Tax=Kickxella alabastrina TaxID=61397 RepID=A0ACC1IBU3_9FUNG|nr:hypothetical protein LPJ66_008602 [Kickxella alabastrina]